MRWGLGTYMGGTCRLEAGTYLPKAVCMRLCRMLAGVLSWVGSVLEASSLTGWKKVSGASGGATKSTCRGGACTFRNSISLGYGCFGGSVRVGRGCMLRNRDYRHIHRTMCVCIVM